MDNTPEWEYLSCSEEPLSSDSFLFHGSEHIWIFDAGNSRDNISRIKALGVRPNVIISHFHVDHTGLLKEIPFDKLLVSRFTSKYTGGMVVEDDMYEEDGDLKLHIFLLPSSHAKGCLALEVNEDVVFLGDGIYGSKYKNGYGYDVSLLSREIRTLKSLKAKKAVMSHENNRVRELRDIINKLEEIYGKRKPGEAYIYEEF